MKKSITCLCMTLLVATFADARPVSYPTGWTAMQTNSDDQNNLHIHYSPTAKYSVGYRGMYNKDDNWQFHGIQVNNLIKRWNKPQSQANFYLKSGVGFSKGDDKNGDRTTEATAFTGMALDWEDRRYFTSYENHLHEAGDIKRGFSQSARVGVAPYIGDYGDLHTWLMLQVDHDPEADKPVTATPLIRMFKGEYLGEFGVRDNGDILLNLVIRY